MKAAVLHAKNDIRIEEVEVPALRPGDILVQVKATGICGSDLPRVMGEAAHHYPIILGHEFAGRVVDVGSAVTRVKVGDRIAGVPLVPCFACRDCLNGHYAQCKHYSFIGSRVNGSWADYVAIPERNALLLGDDISYEEAALIEPSAVALHGLNLIDFRGGEHVAILGGGNIGLLTMQWAKILGARSVTVFDIQEEKLETARQLGADHAIDPSRQPDEWQKVTEGQGFGVVMETAGADATMRLSLQIADSKAKVCFIGTPVRDLTFPHKLFELLNRKELVLTGSWMSYSAPYPGSEWDLTLEHIRSRKLNLKDVVHHRLPLHQIREAFELYRRPGAVKGKILLLND
jgi:L-iditol 2-dehydrogenase